MVGLARSPGGPALDDDELIRFTSHVLACCLCTPRLFSTSTYPRQLCHVGAVRWRNISMETRTAIVKDLIADGLELASEL